MRRVLYLLPVVTLLFAVSGFAQLTAATGPDNAPKIGDMAPDFQVSAGGRGAIVSGGAGSCVGGAGTYPWRVGPLRSTVILSSTRRSRSMAAR